MNQATARTADIEADIARLESGIRQLKVQYDMFFAGSLPLPPRELRGQIEKLIRRYEHAPIQKYHHRFHFNALVSRFNSLSELWGKTVRRIEEGDRRGPRPAGTGPALREKLLARCRIQNPREDEQSMRGMYDRYVEARRENGPKKKTVSFQKFLQGVAAQTQRLQNQAGCAEIELRLVVKDDKVQLKARPSR